MTSKRSRNLQDKNMREIVISDNLYRSLEKFHRSFQDLTFEDNDFYRFKFEGFDEILRKHYTLPLPIYSPSPHYRKI